jgi:hypothetical protein
VNAAAMVTACLRRQQGEVALTEYRANEPDPPVQVYLPPEPMGCEDVYPIEEGAP